jgi:hypothetical protein
MRKTLLTSVVILLVLILIFVGYFEIVSSNSKGLSESEKMSILATTLNREVETNDPVAKPDSVVSGDEVSFELAGAFEPYLVDEESVRKNPQVVESYRFRSEMPTATAVIQILRQQKVLKINEASGVSGRLTNPDYQVLEVMWAGKRGLEFRKTKDGNEISVFILNNEKNIFNSTFG